jgi:hypothetical protein
MSSYTEPMMTGSSMKNSNNQRCLTTVTRVSRTDLRLQVRMTKNPTKIVHKKILILL